MCGGLFISCFFWDWHVCWPGAEALDLRHPPAAFFVSAQGTSIVLFQRNIPNISVPWAVQRLMALIFIKRWVKVIFFLETGKSRSMDWCAKETRFCGLQGCSIFDTLGFTRKPATLTFLPPRGSAKMLGAAGATVAAGYAATVTRSQIAWSMFGLSATGWGWSDVSCIESTEMVGLCVRNPKNEDWTDWWTVVVFQGECSTGKSSTMGGFSGQKPKRIPGVKPFVKTLQVNWERTAGHPFCKKATHGMTFGGWSCLAKLTQSYTFDVPVLWHSIPFLIYGRLVPRLHSLGTWSNLKRAEHDCLQKDSSQNRHIQCGCGAM